MSRYVIILVISIALNACSTVTPDLVKSKSASFDSSTPEQYNARNSGYLFRTNGGAVLTDNGKLYYNSLVRRYGDQIIPAIKVDEGLKPYQDKFGNRLWWIDNQHFVYFQFMSVMWHSRIEEKSFLEKIIK